MGMRSVGAYVGENECFCGCGEEGGLDRGKERFV